MACSVTHAHLLHNHVTLSQAETNPVKQYVVTI